jgi:hypothetical protein
MQGYGRFVRRESNLTAWEGRRHTSEDPKTESLGL